jgi:hypothetical protein
MTAPRRNTRTPGAPAVDTTVPHVARVYDYLLGGGLNFEGDRQLGDVLERILPAARLIARDNADFIARAVTWAARQGIGQFLDLGAGLPKNPPLHVAARDVDPDARMVHVDTDAVVMAHRRAQAGAVAGVAAVEADLRDPAAVLGRREVRDLIDLAEPACVILGFVPNFMAPGKVREVIGGYAEAVTAGSVVVISAVRADDEERFAALSEAYEYAGRSWNHPPRVFRSFLDGLEIADRVTSAWAWRGGQPGLGLSRGDVYVLAGVGRKH